MNHLVRQTMKIHTSRFKPAFKAMSVHFGLSLLVAAAVALLVFTLWFPYPYRELAGGKELFILVMAVDIVCGPLLTFVLFSPTKPKKELITDISLIAVIQILALCYGIWTVWQVRPIYLVQESNKFTIISRSSLLASELNEISEELKPTYFGEPIRVGLRELTYLESQKIIADIRAGGHDAYEHPIFYTKYDGRKAYTNANSLASLIRVQPELKSQVNEIISRSGANGLNHLRYLYIVGRQYWIAVINSSGQVVGFITSS
jgi:hypothetical protein